MQRNQFKLSSPEDLPLAVPGTSSFASVYLTPNLRLRSHLLASLLMWMQLEQPELSTMKHA
jgi:hypothetical protein